MMTVNKICSFSIAILFIISVYIGSLIVLQPRVNAFDGDDFDAGRIIDDHVFYNDSSMSVSKIQKFLDDMMPDCDTNGTTPHWSGGTRADYGASRGYPAPYTCLTDFSQTVPAIVNGGSDLCKNSVSAGTKSAARIIYDVAKACDINPQVLLVMLEKEQSLITDEWPWPIQYTKALGYGCPDTDLPASVDANDNGCYDDDEGFFKQVYAAAEGFRRYEANPNNYNYKANRNNTILYHPNSSCGSSTVYIQNQATASLYIYTPYQPNQAALDNLYGSGNSCSAYGNRNFWRIFKDWFGSTTSTWSSWSAVAGGNQWSTESPVDLSTGKSGKFTLTSLTDNGTLRIRRGTFGGKWGGWSTHAGGANWSSATSGYNSDTNLPRMFAVNKSGQMYYRYLSSDDGWSDWSRVAGGTQWSTESAVNLSTGEDGKFTITALTKDGTLRVRNGSFGDGWGDWANHKGGDNWSSAAADFNSISNRRRIFATDKDGKLYYRYQFN